ncbi:hypothetical protein QFZ32_006529 [Streptomyces canus]|nr:hypothetical protein [Streptomyces canus]MDQ1071089.1 hypothetical protein [Streptomyces canus]
MEGGCGRRVGGGPRAEPLRGGFHGLREQDGNGHRPDTADNRGEGASRPVCRESPHDCVLAGEADVPYASHLCAVTSVLEVNEATASMITAG